MDSDSDLDLLDSDEDSDDDLEAIAKAALGSTSSKKKGLDFAKIIAIEKKKESELTDSDLDLMVAYDDWKTKAEKIKKKDLDDLNEEELDILEVHFFSRKFYEIQKCATKSCF